MLSKQRIRLGLILIRRLLSVSSILRNVGELVPDYIASQPTIRIILDSHRCENLESKMFFGSNPKHIWVSGVGDLYFRIQIKFTEVNVAKKISVTYFTPILS
jgi:hypothetical protein